MDTGANLLAQRLAAPDDEALRMVYADWLEQQGNPAAGVVRGSPQVRRLLAKHRWLVPIADWIAAGAPFDRGMLWKIQGKVGKYVTKASQAALLGPLSIFGVRSTIVSGPSAKVPACTTLGFTTSLWWWNCQADDTTVSALARSPHLGYVTDLLLEKVKCSNKGLGALARSNLTRVRKLGLRAPVHLGEVDARGVISLAKRRGMTSVTPCTSLPLGSRARSSAASPA